MTKLPSLTSFSTWKSTKPKSEQTLMMFQLECDAWWSLSLCGSSGPHQIHRGQIGLIHRHQEHLPHHKQFLQANQWTSCLARTRQDPLHSKATKRKLKTSKEYLISNTKILKSVIIFLILKLFKTYELYLVAVSCYDILFTFWKSFHCQSLGEWSFSSFELFKIFNSLIKLN